MSKKRTRKTPPVTATNLEKVTSEPQAFKPKRSKEFEACGSTAMDLIRWMRAGLTERQRQARLCAKRAQEKHKSDPFVYNRVYSRIVNGVDTPTDFSVV